LRYDFGLLRRFFVRSPTVAFGVISLLAAGCATLLGLDEERTLRADGGAAPTGGGGEAGGAVGSGGAGGASRRYFDAVMADEPIAYWRFEEEQGDFENEIDRDRPLSPEAGVLHDARGAVGSGAGFDGDVSADAGDHFAFADDHDMTLEVWAWAPRPSGAAHYQHLVGKRQVAGGNTNGYSLSLDTVPQLSFSRLQGTGSRNAEGAMIFESFVHIVATFDKKSGVSTLYINGVEAEKKLDAGVINIPSTAGEPFRVAGSSNVRFKGTLDELALYEYALSEDQVKAHYNVVRPP